METHLWFSQRFSAPGVVPIQRYTDALREAERMKDGQGFCQIPLGRLNLTADQLYQLMVFFAQNARWIENDGQRISITYSHNAYLRANNAANGAIKGGMTFDNHHKMLYFQGRSPVYGPISHALFAVTTTGIWPGDVVNLNTILKIRKNINDSDIFVDADNCAPRTAHQVAPALPAQPQPTGWGQPANLTFAQVVNNNAPANITAVAPKAAPTVAPQAAHALHQPARNQQNGNAQPTRRGMVGNVATTQTDDRPTLIDLADISDWEIEDIVELMDILQAHLKDRLS